ncbi:MAG: hypothetical protein HW421_1402 [Ignavibacteria bacterium]|nr:hypothetical protein [Ignavibacteria bacterium]
MKTKNLKKKINWENDNEVHFLIGKFSNFQITNILFTFLFLFVSSLFFFTGCQSRKTVTIALSKGHGSENYKFYYSWLKNADPNIDIIDLYTMKINEALNVLDNCDGIIFTGGPDVHPIKYGKPEDSSRCEIDIKRDNFEFQLINKARKLEIPIFGVCRGQQILNIAFGGNLIVDIPSDFSKQVIHRSDKGFDCFHDVTIDTNSLIYRITKVRKGKVNSFHHQAVGRVADAFNVAGRTDDNLIEALELKSGTELQSIFSVQWHPERLDTVNPLSLPLARYFIGEAIKKRKIAMK